MLSLITTRITVDRDEPTHVVLFNVESHDWMSAEQREKHAQVCVICAATADDPIRGIRAHLGRCAKDAGSIAHDDYTLIKSSVVIRPLTSAEKEAISGPN